MASDSLRQNGIVSTWAMVLTTRKITIQVPGLSLPSTNLMMKKLIAVAVNRPKSCTNLTASSAMNGLLAKAVFSCAPNDTRWVSRGRIGALAVPKKGKDMKMMTRIPNSTPIRV